MTHYLPSLISDFLFAGRSLLLYMVIFISLERIFTLHKQKIFRKEFLVDLGYYFLNGIFVKILIPISILLFLVHNVSLPLGIYALVAKIPLPIRFMLAIIVGDIGAYWGHRWSHEIPFLWRFHSIHHSAEEIDWLVNNRGHPLDVAFTRFCGLIPIYLLGFGQKMYSSGDLVMIIYVLFGTTWSYFIHANVAWRFGWLETFLATPAFHHWHHTNDGPDYIDKNYAAIFPWIDKLFGSYYLPSKRWPEKYGIDAPMPSNFFRQLVKPFG